MSGTGSGKVIKRYFICCVYILMSSLLTLYMYSYPHPCSGPNDYVFVNFADHGATNFVSFPDGEVFQLY